MRHYTHTYEQFLQRAHLIHGDIYDYLLSKEEFQTANLNNRTPPYITIICKACGNIFRQLKSSHIGSESGCPKCIASSKEKLIRNYLEDNGVPFLILLSNIFSLISIKHFLLLRANKSDIFNYLF